MVYRLRFGFIGAALVSLAAGLGCGNDITLPPDLTDVRVIQVVTGNNQTAPPGTVLPVPVTVEVSRLRRSPDRLEPEAGVTVIWTPSGGGTTQPDTSVTGDSGLATVNWTLGAVDGLQQITVVDADAFADTLTLFATSLDAGSCPETGGTLHSGTILSAETWGRGLHRIPGSIVVEAELTIEPGARICVTPGQRIQIGDRGRLMAFGSLDEPIVFTCSDTTRLWDGIWFTSLLSLTSFVNDVRVEFSERGIHSLSAVHPIRIDRALIYGGGQSALRLMASGSTVSRSLIDGTKSGDQAVFLSVTGNSSSMTFDATVRNAAQDGILIQGWPMTQVTMLNCEIYGSGGNGLVVEPEQGTVTVEIRNSNIFDNAGHGIDNRTTRVCPVDSECDLLNAQFNWWGDPGGPLAPGGETTSRLVDFSFWLSAPADVGERPPPR